MVGDIAEELELFVGHIHDAGIRETCSLALARLPSAIDDSPDPASPR